MNAIPPRHLWIISPQSPSGAEVAGMLGLSTPVLVASANRRLRGPYTAAGEVARQLVPAVIDAAPDLASRHDVELLAVAPELAAIVPLRRATLTALTTPRNRTRFYPSGRTTRLAHGFTEFLTAAAGTAAGPGTLLVTDVDDADMTDVEWLGILLRRMDGRAWRMIVHSRGEDLPEPLGVALRRYATRQDAPVRDAAVDRLQPDPAALAADYVDSECTSAAPGSVAAYRDMDPSVRSALHDARADALEALDEPSLRIGAIPFHRERGSDPRGAGAGALLHAIEHCVLEGYYNSVVELGPRCFSVLDWESRTTDCWLVTAKVTTALTALDRADEAEAFYDEACAATTSPSVHLQSAYGRAMLFTRFYQDSRRDHLKAKAWVNTAITISSLLPDDQRRAFNLTFNENGLALVEMHLGDLAEARRLVEVGMARLDAEVNPSQHTQHRSVLAYNRAQLLAATGELAEALSAYDEVITADPHHSEYYFERASIFRRLGRLDAAMADYERAILESPPYPEPHYNRGDLAAQLGDIEGALSAFSYVIELEPTFVDAYVNRAALRLSIGDIDGAAADVTVGLALRPAHAQLHCLRGLAALEQDDVMTAGAAFDRALMIDPRLAEALANRAVLRFEGGDTAGAIEDLSAALAIADDPAVRENRAVAYLAAGQLAEAIADCEAGLSHPDGDRESLNQLLARCLGGLAMSA